MTNKHELREAAENVIQKYGSEWFETGHQVCTVHRSKIMLIAAANPVAVLALLDELEVATDACNGWQGMYAEADERLRAAEKRIAELEAREVKMKQFTEFQICHYGASEDYAKGYIDCQKNYNKALGAAGILVSINGEW